jgi:tetratricopeptide (TPR) repeat protein
LRKYPNNSEIASTAGHLYARLGERAKALKLAAFLAETHRESPLTLYDAASIAAAAGDRNTAIEFLKQAISAGFEEKALLTRDPDLEGVRRDPRFKQVLASLP